MLHPCHSFSGGQQLVQVAAPARRVLTDAIAAGRRPRKDSLKPHPNAGCSFGLLLPNGFKNLHAQRSVYVRDRQISDEGIDIVSKGICPLACVLWVAPAAFVSGKVTPRRTA